MPDKKVDQYEPATSWSGAELLYVVQGALDKCLSLTTLFSNIPVLAKFTGKIGLGGTPNNVTGSGAADVTKTTTFVTNTAPSTLSLPAGNFDGQVKLIIAQSIVGNVSLLGTLGSNGITLTKTGDSAVVLYTQGKWWFVGGSALVT